MTEWKPIEYQHDGKGNIVLPAIAPFDGAPVLIKAAGGVVEAWWDNGKWSEDTPNAPAEYNGFVWVCYDDAFALDLDEPTHWQPLPEPPQ